MFGGCLIIIIIINTTIIIIMFIIQAFVPYTFWVRSATSAHEATFSEEQMAYLDEFEKDDVCVTFVIVPVWTLTRDFAQETLTLLSEQGVKTVRFSDGVAHGWWRFERTVAQANGTWASFLTVWYGRGDMHWTSRTSTPQATPQNIELRYRRFELMWGTSTWVKRPDAAGDDPAWSTFLVPLINQNLDLCGAPRKPRTSLTWLQRWCAWCWA